MLFTAYVQKAIAFSGASAVGLLAKRAALVIDKPDAYLSRIIALLTDGADGLRSLTVLEHTFGILSFNSWGVLAALSEYTAPERQIPQWRRCKKLRLVLLSRMPQASLQCRGIT